MASEGQKAASESPLRLAIEALHGRARAEKIHSATSVHPNGTHCVFGAPPRLARVNAYWVALCHP